MSCLFQCLSEPFVEHVAAELVYTRCNGSTMTAPTKGKHEDSWCYPSCMAAAPASSGGGAGRLRTVRCGLGAFGLPAM